MKQKQVQLLKFYAFLTTYWRPYETKITSHALSRAEKEKAKLQQEVFDLLAQIESANKDRVLSNWQYILNKWC